jgi:hypothetical protein
MKLRIREKLVGAAYDELMLTDSWRLALIGHSRRRKLSEAFIDTMEAGGDKEMFREKCKDYGLSLMLIVLVLSVAWDVFWYWWTHRKKEVAE